jgi:hypothetical protein
MGKIIVDQFDSTTTRRQPLNNHKNHHPQLISLPKLTAALAFPYHYQQHR